MFLNVCICTTCMQGPVEHKSLLDLMELEFQTVVNYLCGSRNQTWVLSKSKCYYLVRYPHSSPKAHFKEHKYQTGKHGYYN